MNAIDKHGQTALYEVTRNWNVDVARYLVRYGAELNHKDKMGRTPLHLAAAVNHYEMVDFLVKNGGVYYIFWGLFFEIILNFH